MMENICPSKKKMKKMLHKVTLGGTHTVLMYCVVKLLVYPIKSTFIDVCVNKVNDIHASDSCTSNARF